MPILLNRQTLSRDPDVDQGRLPELVKLLRKPEMDHVRIFGEDYGYLRDCFQRRYGKESGNAYFQSFFHRPYAGESVTPEIHARMVAHVYEARLAEGNGKVVFKVGDLALASLLGWISAGLKDAGQGNGVEYSVVEKVQATGRCTQEFSALMIVTNDQLSMPSYRRWHFIEHAAERESYKGAFELAADYHKHFAVSAKKYGNVPLKRQPWVASTKKKRDKTKTALFCPGLFEYGPRIRSFIVMALREAYAHQHFLASDQNGTMVDVGETVGASDGDLTSRIELYVSDEAGVHIRPV